MRLIAALSTIGLLAAMTLPVWAQGTASKGGSEVVMLDEIVIRVEAELPTVMVTISRQSPEMQSGELMRPADAVLLDYNSTAKPLPATFKVSRIEDPQKLLAKPREP
jgi:hypothetical protein